MNHNWKYLSTRIKLIVAATSIVSWLLWILAFRFSFPDKERMILVGILGMLLLAVSVFSVRWILVPYNRQDENIQLFLSGYTAAGLKNPEYVLSPGTEQLYETVISLLESDALLKANKRQAQYLALQNQINPHFLYNTLESIRSEAMEAGIYNVMNMTEALANFFRYTISKVENIVTLEEELQNMETYFSIQQYRFEDKLNLSVEYEEEERERLFKCLMPKLILQPVVENSIVHGIERKLGSGTVRVILSCTEKRLLIQVSDDGVGMQPETLEQLNRHLNQPVFDSIRLAREKGGIAIVNVNNRIHLMFGETYGISINSAPGVGTDVMINLPLVTSKRQINNGEELQ